MLKIIFGIQFKIKGKISTKIPLYEVKKQVLKCKEYDARTNANALLKCVHELSELIV